MKRQKKKFFTVNILITTSVMYEKNFSEWFTRIIACIVEKFMEVDIFVRYFQNIKQEILKLSCLKLKFVYLKKPQNLRR